MAQQGPFWAIYQDLKAGQITRRSFIAKATALGVGLPVTMFVLNSVKIGGAFAQDAAPSCSARQPARWPDPRRRRRTEDSPMASRNQRIHPQGSRHQGPTRIVIYPRATHE